MSPIPWRAVPKVWKKTHILRCRSSLLAILSSHTAGQPWGRFPVGLAGSHPGDTLVPLSPWESWRDPKSSPMLQPGLLRLGARLCSSSATWWVAVPLHSQGPGVGTRLQLRDPAAPPEIIWRQRGTSHQPSRHSPSLLLVTGMLWTVRSLKQDPVSTCSSTELRTKAWRSGRGQERSLQRDAASAGPGTKQAVILRDLLMVPGRGQESQEGLGSPKLTLLLQFLNGLPPLGPLIVG